VIPLELAVATTFLRGKAHLKGNGIGLQEDAVVNASHPIEKAQESAEKVNYSFTLIHFSRCFYFVKNFPQ